MDTKKSVLKVSSICLRVALAVTVVLGILYLGRAAYHGTRAVFCEEAFEEDPGRSVRVKIPEGADEKYVAETLEEKGIIKDSKIFIIQMKIDGFKGPVEAGTYQLNSSMTPSEILRILSGEDEDGSL